MVPRYTSTAYLLWLIGGWTGSHHFYLGRHLQGVIWVTTCNMLGMGWLRDVVRIPDYVRLANASAQHERYMTKYMQLTQVPPMNGSHVMAMAMLGTWYYYVVIGMSSFIFPIEYIAASYAAGSLAMSVGVWAAGSCGPASCSLNHISFTVIAIHSCFSSLRFAALLITLPAAILAAVWTRRWRVERNGVLSFYAAIVTLVMIGAFTNAFAYFAICWADDTGLIWQDINGRTILNRELLHKRIVAGLNVLIEGLNNLQPPHFIFDFFAFDGIINVFFKPVWIEAGVWWQNLH